MNTNELMSRINNLMDNENLEKNEALPICVVKTIIKIAVSAPSGANQQPWSYVLIKSDNIINKIKKEMNSLPNNPCFIALFKQNYGMDLKSETKITHYYAHESACLSAGFLLGGLSYLNASYKVLPISNDLTTLLARPQNETALFLVAISQMDETNTSLNKKVNDYYDLIQTRRSVRSYNKTTFDKIILTKVIQQVSKVVDRDVIDMFKVVADPHVKQEIRTKAEENEQRLYKKLITKSWQKALTPLGTNWQKAHLTEAPYLIIVLSNKEKKDHKADSLIATGVLIQLLHFIGLSTLTYTPSPMNFLTELLNTSSKTAVMVLPVGFKAKDYQAPDIKRKDIEDVLFEY